MNQRRNRTLHGDTEHSCWKTRRSPVSAVRNFVFRVDADILCAMDASPASDITKAQLQQSIETYDLRHVVRSQLSVCRQPVKLDYFRVADYPGMIGKGYADLRDLPLGGT